MKRYAERDDHMDFINAMNIFWENWLLELKEQSYCEHYILKSNQHLNDIIKINRQ